MLVKSKTGFKKYPLLTMNIKDTVLFDICILKNVGLYYDSTEVLLSSKHLCSVPILVFQIEIYK